MKKILSKDKDKKINSSLQTRKQRRKLERKFLKAKRKAWSQREKIPTSIELLIDEQKKTKKKKKKKKRKNNRTKDESSDELEFDEQEAKEMRKRNLVEDNQIEEKNIKKLEKLLGIKPNQKSLSIGFLNDGLDYLLEFCDKDKRKEILKIDGYGNENVWENDSIDEDQIWLKNKQEKRIQREKEKNEENSIESSDRKRKRFVRFDDQIQTKILHSELSDEDSSIDEQQQTTSNKDENKEDIYGRNIDQQGNVKQKSIGLYVPPALRNDPFSSEDQSIVELKRKVQGQLNRLSEMNISSILNEIERIYRCNARALVNQCLLIFYDQMLFSSTSMSNESLISEYALLLSLLHGNVGLEIGSFLLENILEKLVKHLDDDVQEKTSDNLIRFLSYVYAFHIVNSQLIFDLLRLILNVEKITEKRFELILLILKTVGFILRKDKPLELKEILQKLRTISLSNDDKFNSSSTRFQYLIDTIQSLKNNDIRKLPGSFDPERIDRMRKIHRNLTKDKSTQQSNVLNVSLNDLLNAKQQGRWWIVGSAWSKSSSTKSISTQKENKQILFDDEIIQLSRDQHMNTDIRKIIFSTLISSQDCDDAYEKIQKLNLTKIQEREIIHVTVHCCLQENSFNPYYSLVLQRFLNFDRRFQISFQYHIWDRFKDLSSINDQQLKNLALTLSHLLRSQTIHLNIFKTFNFMELTNSSKTFLIELFVSLFNENDERTLKKIFTIQKKSNWKFLEGAIKLFLNHFIINKSKYSDLIRDRCRFAVENFLVE